jgi:hypothetical protein
MSDEDFETFHLPVPPPLPPHARGDVLFKVRRVVEGEEGKESEDIMLRSVPRATAQRFRAAAGGRGMTHAQYLAALVQLHEAMRARADGGDGDLAAELEQLGLTTISI